MNNEYIQIHQHLGFSIAELFQISLNGVETAFIDDKKKSALRESFSQEYQRITNRLES